MQEEDFAFPILTIDAVVFQLQDGELTVLTIERGFEPFKGALALPGAYISKTETSPMALERMLVEKTGVSARQLRLVEQPYAFDAAGRDPRGYAVTVIYMGLCKGVTPGTHAGMTLGQNPQFRPLKGLRLAYDHNRIVAFAHDRLKVLATSTNAVAPLLPKTFTLTELQSAYQAIFSKQLDKRNFRKKILSLGVLQETGTLAKDGAHRPAREYAFRSAKLTSFSQNFI